MISSELRKKKNSYVYGYVYTWGGWCVHVNTRKFDSYLQKLTKTNKDIGHNPFVAWKITYRIIKYWILAVLQHEKMVWFSRRQQCILHLLKSWRRQQTKTSSFVWWYQRVQIGRIQNVKTQTLLLKLGGKIGNRF